MEIGGTGIPRDSQESVGLGGDSLFPFAYLQVVVGLCESPPVLLLVDTLLQVGARLHSSKFQ